MPLSITQAEETHQNCVAVLKPIKKRSKVCLVKFGKSLGFDLSCLTIEIVGLNLLLR